MGSCCSKEQQLDEWEKRIKKERKARVRAKKERDKEERAERDRVAKSDLIRIMLVSPAPGYEIEIHELETVLVLLEKFALLLGLNRSAAKSLQLEFSGTTLAHEQQLEPAGIFNGVTCTILGAEVLLLSKANSVDIFAAAYAAGGYRNHQKRILDVGVVCRYAPEKVMETDAVMLLM